MRGNALHSFRKVGMMGAMPTALGGHVREFKTHCPPRLSQLAGRGFRAATVRERGLTLIVRVTARSLTVAALRIRMQLPDSVTALGENVLPSMPTPSRGHGTQCFNSGASGRLRLGFAVAVASLIVASGPSVARADGGTVRFSETVGPYRVTAFTSPNPFRAGPVEISVLVQDAATGDSLPDAKVTLHVAPRDQPDDTLDYQATSGTTTNKLFHSATFELPDPGEWTVAIDVAAAAGPSRASFDVVAADRLPRWVSFWPWFSWPFAVIALFAVHQALTGKSTANRSRAAGV
jgi:hypothetical protein